MSFYDRITGSLYRGSLPSWQKAPITLLIEEGRQRGRLNREIAYVLATAHHETSRFRPRYMEEIGKGRGKRYGKPIYLSRRKRITYHGRGFVQLTWLANYMAMSCILKIDLVSNPDLAKEHDVAAKVIWEGMIRGTFTGRNLADYFGHNLTDFVGARRIVNGTDRADLIAEYAAEFEAALE